MFRSIAGRLLAPSLAGLIGLTGLTGCYEGWEYDRKGGGGPDTPKTPETPATPPFFYILLEPIYLSDAAVADGKCFAEPGLSEFRKAEWQERIGRLAEKLTPLAQNFVLTRHAIAKDDCEKLSALRTASVATKPWAPNPDPGDDPLDRSLVNIRAVFWEGDVESEPLAAVTAADWVAFSAMKKAGRKAKTLNHFVLEHAGEGYFNSWKKATAKDASVDGTEINDVDPSDAGKAARAATINGDADKVVQWLLEHP